MPVRSLSLSLHLFLLLLLSARSVSGCAATPNDDDDDSGSDEENCDETCQNPYSMSDCTAAGHAAAECFTPGLYNGQPPPVGVCSVSVVSCDNPMWTLTMVTNAGSTDYAGNAGLLIYCEPGAKQVLPINGETVESLYCYESSTTPATAVCGTTPCPDLEDTARCKADGNAAADCHDVSVRLPVQRPDGTCSAELLSCNNPDQKLVIQTDSGSEIESSGVAVLTLVCQTDASITYGTETIEAFYCRS